MNPFRVLKHVQGDYRKYVESFSLIRSEDVRDAVREAINNDELLYKKAQKRVKEISNFYWFVAGYIMVAFILLYKDYSNNIFNFKTEYIVFMLILQGIFRVRMIFSSQEA